MNHNIRLSTREVQKDLPGSNPNIQMPDLLGGSAISRAPYQPKSTTFRNRKIPPWRLRQWCRNKSTALVASGAAVAFFGYFFQLLEKSY
jgi:hypothetical protein